MSPRSSTVFGSEALTDHCTEIAKSDTNYDKLAREPRRLSKNDRDWRIVIGSVIVMRSRKRLNQNRKESTTSQIRHGPERPGEQSPRDDPAAAAGAAIGLTLLGRNPMAQAAHRENAP